MEHTGQIERNFEKTTLSNAFASMMMFSIQISLKSVPKSAINIKSPLIQILAWDQTVEKLLSELMVT